jgi:lysozyme
MKIPLKTSITGERLVEASEGFRSTVYLDANGFRTIGYGHKLRSGEVFANGITKDQGEFLLQLDLEAAEHAVNTLVTVQLNQDQMDAMVDWTFALGWGSLQHSTLLKVLNEGRFDLVPSELAKWCIAAGKRQPGLVTRRNAEAELFRAVPGMPVSA